MSQRVQAERIGALARQAREAGLAPILGAAPAHLVAADKWGTNGTAAKVTNFDRWREKGRPWHFWGDESRLTGVHKNSHCQKTRKLQ